ncbi:hypothetical protein FGO68_gene12351 [Halteria grandinella]|uniref:Uncharacterized protein n=1 Tax=Halteria grandinella TaxID=5974 RepID=A0A8J8NWF9_HALGN|nr:hypothetical protein FGO68_gene12351 [Halteria grandinella]
MTKQIRIYFIRKQYQNKSMKSKIAAKVIKPSPDASQLKKTAQPQKETIVPKKIEKPATQFKIQRNLTQFSKLTFGKRIISKYLILEIFSYTSGRKKGFRYISQISYGWRFFISLN